MIYHFKIVYMRFMTWQLATIMQGVVQKLGGGIGMRGVSYPLPPDLEVKTPSLPESVG